MKPGKNLTLGSLLLFVVFAVASLALYGGAKAIEPEEEAVAEEDDAISGVVGGAVTIEFVARNLSFAKRRVSVPPSANVIAVLDNQDGGVLHNVAFYTQGNAAQAIFKGTIFEGPATLEESFEAPSVPGDYYFRCDVHPDTMNGTFRVR